MNKTIEESTKYVLHILEAIPYADYRIRYYGRCYQNIIHYCSESRIQSFSYEDAADFFSMQMERVVNREIGKNYALTMRKAAFMLADYYVTGIVFWKRRNYHIYPLSDDYRKLLTDFETSIADSLAKESVRLVVRIARNFLIYLNEQKCDNISSLDISHIRSFVIKEAPKYNGNRVNLTWPIKRFLRYLLSINLTDINAELILTNPVPAKKKVLPQLENVEIKALFLSVDKNTMLGKRDYAIMKLALDTGLRWSDISGMKLTDIDWRKKEIHIIQKKTKTNLVLPLTVGAGNAVADYILNARQKCNSDYIFLRVRRPYERLQSSATNIMNRYQSAAGIIRHAGDGKTFQAFRRTMGTNLLKSDVPLTTVSQILGHNNLDSTKRYLSLHDEMLLSCCMDISIYATEKEGLK